MIEINTFTESKVVTEPTVKVLEPKANVVEPTVKITEPKAKIGEPVKKSVLFKGVGGQAPAVVPITLTNSSFTVWADVGYYPPITPANSGVTAQFNALTAKSIDFEQY